VIIRLARGLTETPASQGEAEGPRPSGFGLLIQCPKEYRDCVHEARALFERALEIDPNDARLWLEAPKPCKDEAIEKLKEKLNSQEQQ
jgi:hypothetical protein